MTVLAVTDWPEAAIAIAGIAMVTIVASVLAWQIFATGRTGLTSRREAEYAGSSTSSPPCSGRRRPSCRRPTRRSPSSRSQVRELEQGVKEVDRILKAVE